MKKIIGSSLLTLMLGVSAISAEKSVYYTSWGQDPTIAQELTKSFSGNIYGSFLRWDGLGNIKDDDGMFYDGIPDYWESNAYKGIRLLSNNTNTKVIATFGGWTYSGMWDIILNDTDRETIAQNIVALMGGKIGKTWDNKYLNTGLNIAGIDFDFERQVRITPELNDAFVKLIKRIRELQKDVAFASKIGISDMSSISNDKIYVTTYHVGADPVECGSNPQLGPNDGCSFVDENRSLHHGEVLRAFKQFKENPDLVDGFNLMLYDAGKSGVDFYPDVAIDNYLKYIPANKTNGGITVKKQWGPDGNFIQAEEINRSHIKLFKEKNLNGFFVWSLGGSDIALGETSATENLAQLSKLSRTWDGEYQDANYIKQPFNPSTTEASPGTTSVLGQDHTIVTKNGKSYVALGHTWYETGNTIETPNETPSIQIEEFTREGWPGFAADANNRVNHLCRNGSQLNTNEIFADKNYLNIISQDGSWCRNIDIPQASKEMKGKIIDVYRNSTWMTTVNGKDLPAWKITRYSYK